MITTTVVSKIGNWPSLQNILKSYANISHGQYFIIA